MANIVHVAKGDFVELKFTGKINGTTFDSNIAEDLKMADSKLEPRKLNIRIGERMVVKGLDSALEGKELNVQYNIHIPFKEGFGPRHPSLIKTIPLHVFTAQKIYPESGMTLALDNSLVQIRAVSGARVIADFNNPLAGKDLDYSFVIVRKIEDIAEKARVFFEWFIAAVPELSVGDSVTIKAQAKLKPLIIAFKDKFKELVGKELLFEAVVEEAVRKDARESESPAAQDATQQSL